MVIQTILNPFNSNSTQPIFLQIIYEDGIWHCLQILNKVQVYYNDPLPFIHQIGYPVKGGNQIGLTSFVFNKYMLAASYHSFGFQVFTNFIF